MGSLGGVPDLATCEARCVELKEQISSLQEQIADSIREQLGAKVALEAKKKARKKDKKLNPKNATLQQSKKMLEHEHKKDFFDGL